LTGTWLDKTGTLAASPDGLIGKDSVCEIKTNYKLRNESIKNYLEVSTLSFKISLEQ
jgi:hypothetical protein